MTRLRPLKGSLADGRLQRTPPESDSMGMPATTRKWTAEMLRALPEDGNRYEIVRGELLVTPSPSLLHQRALSLLHGQFLSYLRDQPSAEVLISPADIELETDSVVQPDLFVFPREEGRIARRWADIRQLLLAVEILSPSSARADRITKRRLYMEHDVAEYWIVDLDARSIERWRADEERPDIVAERLEWRVAQDAPPMVIELPELFVAVLGE